MITPGYKIIKSIKEIALEESIIFDFEMGSDSKDVPAYLWHHKDVYFLMLSITTDYNNNYILPLNKAYGYPVPSKKDLLELIDICEDDSIRKINHNIKFDMHCLRRLVGQEIKWTSKTLWDTQIIGHLIDSTELKSLANWTEIYAPQFAGYKENMDYSLKTPFKKMADYAITDTHITGILDDEFYTILENDEVLLNHYLIYCQPSLLSLFLAEENGAHIDRKQVERWIIKGDKYAEEKIIELNNEPNVEKYKHYKRRSLGKKKIDDINEKLDKHKEGSKQFEKYIKKIKDIKSGKLNLFPKVNFGSPKQMSELLFGKYGFGFRGTSTSEEALKEIGIDFTESLLDLRAINKINGTYFKGIEKNLTEDNKLHCSFNLAGTATGRLSSSDPNLQNIPKHVKREDVKEYIKAVRSFFIAPEDYYFFQADFSQAELRMIANISKDETMIEAYLNDVDIHANTGAYFAGMTLDQFYDSDEKTFGENRQIAKCFHPDTEVLTKNGWKKITNLDIGEEVLEAVPKKGDDISLNWAKPNQVYSQKNEYDYLVELVNEGINLQVTPDHLLLGANNNKDKYLYWPEDLNNCRYHFNAGILNKGELFDNWWLRAAVIAQADGSYSGLVIRFGFTKKRKIDRFKKVFSEDMYTFKISKQGVSTFVLNREVSSKIKSLLEEKKFPWWWLSLSLDNRLNILDELKYWDSTTNNKLNCFIYSNTCEQSIGVMQAMAAISGFKSRVTIKEKQNIKYSNCFKLSIKSHNYSRGGNIATKRINYKGEVACLSVPSGYVVVRFKGVVSVQKQSANFGIIYGMYPKGYMRYVYNNTGRRITMQEAEYQINSFFRLYKNLKKWHYASIRAARSLGYSETFFGRRLYLPDINNKNKEEWGKRSAAERNAINMPIQGTVGELTVWAGNFICAECHPSTKYILNVHDSVNGYIRKDKIKSELALIKDIMENLPVKEYFGRELGPVPMKVDIEYGTSWLDLKKYEI